MHNTNQSAQPPRQPLSGAKHFWLSFLAVITGMPIAWMLAGGGFFILMLFFSFMIALSSGGSSPADQTLRMSHIYGDASSTNTIASVPVRGIILSGTAADPLQTLFGQSYADGELIKSQLRYLADDASVDAVVLEVDSPGGMITASKAIADGINYYKKKTNKPVYTHINGTGASGAYWASAATDKIYAEQGSEAGSIGVIMGPLVTIKDVVAYGDVGTTSPIGFRYFTSGRSKDFGSPFRDMTPEEITFLQKQLDSEYEKFVAHVASTRKLSADKIKGEIGALAYGTDDATSLGLIDGMMSKEEVYDELAGAASIKDDFRVMQIDSTVDFWGSVFGAHGILRSGRMSSAEKATGRARFCSNNLLTKPLVFSGDIESVCK